MLFEPWLFLATVSGRETVGLSPWQTGVIFAGIPLGLFLLISAVVLATTKNSPDRDPAQPVLGTPTPVDRPDNVSSAEQPSPNEGNSSDDDAATER